MRQSATDRTKKSDRNLEKYEIAQLEKSVRSTISQDITYLLTMQKGKDNKGKRTSEQMEDREEKKRKNSEGEDTLMKMMEESNCESRKGEDTTTSYYSESSKISDDTVKEEVLFKYGKIWLDGGKLVKSNKEDRKEKSFKKGHKGMCIISIRLKEDKIGSRGIANYTKLIDVVVRKGWRPKEAVKTGFRSADLHYSEIERAIKIFKEMAKTDGIECNILDKNLETWGVIQDWNDKVLHLAEAIDDKKYLNSLEIITYRKYNKEVRDKYETVSTKNILAKFNGRSIPEQTAIRRIGKTKS